MKIDIIQFLKKLNFAGRLAQSDCLFLIDGLKSFSFVSLLAKLWETKNDLEPQQKIAAFLRKENNPFLTQLFNEVAAQTKIVGTTFYFVSAEDKTYDNKSLFKSAAYKAEWEDLRAMCQEVVEQDFPWLDQDLKTLFPIMDLKADMRFYGVEFERLAEYTAAYPEAFPLSIDWGMTDKPELYLELTQSVTMTSKLSAAAQQNLVTLYTGLLFEKKCFVGNFSGVAVDEDARVNFLDFDYLYPFDNSLRHFLDDYLHNNTLPHNLRESRLRRSIETLRFLCPEVDLLPVFDACFLSCPENAETEGADEAEPDGLINVYASQGMLVQPYSKRQDPDGQALRHLLQKPQLGKEKMFGKSSLWYAVLILLLIFLSLKFF